MHLLELKTKWFVPSTLFESGFMIIMVKPEVTLDNAFHQY